MLPSQHDLMWESFRFVIKVPSLLQLYPMKFVLSIMNMLLNAGSDGGDVSTISNEAKSQRSETCSRVRPAIDFPFEILASLKGSLLIVRCLDTLFVVGT